MTEQFNQTNNQKKAKSLPQNHPKKSSQNRKKRDGFSLNKNSQARKSFRAKKKVEFDPSKFYFMYGEGDIPLGMEVLFMDDKPVVHSATTISQARGVVRSDIRRMGGNAAGYLTEERMSVSKNSWAYSPARYEVSAYATLVVPKDLPSEEKEGLFNRLKGNVEFSEDAQKDSDSWGLKVLLMPFIILPVAFALIGLVSWIKH